MLKKIHFPIIPLQIFLFIFWFKNGFIDKVMGITLGVVTPETAYQGDTWQGWAGYIIGNWDKSQVGHAVLSPFFPALFPVVVLLQCVPFILAAMSIIGGEFLQGKDRVWLMRAAVASLFVNGAMLFSQTLSGASDGQYLWQLLGLGMIAIMYIDNQNKK
ncbi:hypothetical protein E1189_09370 [Sansalvadorimonas verongulae]|nr:hypothetical protein [Sansalvadorimonas verongulae]